MVEERLLEQAEWNLQAILPPLWMPWVLTVQRHVRGETAKVCEPRAVEEARRAQLLGCGCCVAVAHVAVRWVVRLSCP